jgi:hypothetical protein
MAVSAARRALALRLSPPVVAEVERRALRWGLAKPQFVVQVIEAFLAEERCQHGPPRPATPTTPSPDR